MGVWSVGVCLKEVEIMGFGSAHIPPELHVLSTFSVPKCAHQSHSHSQYRSCFHRKSCRVERLESVS